MKSFLFTVLLIITYTACGQSNRYENRKYGYSICFPENWIVKEEIRLDLLKTTATNTTDANTTMDYGEITVIVMPNGAQSKLKTYMEHDIEIAKSMGKSCQVIRNQSSTLNKNSAIVVEISIIMANNQKARMINYGIFKNSNLYFIRCFANETFYSKSIDVIKFSCDSFDVK